MFGQLCGLNGKSFLHRRVWQDLRRARDAV